MIFLFALSILEGTPDLRIIYTTSECWCEIIEMDLALSDIERQGPEEKTGRQEKSSANDVKSTKLIRKAYPAYPKTAKDAGIKGVVIVEATTDKYGWVETVKVLRSIPGLDQAAIDAVKKWVHEPMIIEGEPKGVTFTVSCWFSPDIKRSEMAVLGGVTGKDKKPPVRLIGDIKDPNPTKIIDPKYPQEAKEAGIEGEIIVEATTDPNGQVQDVKILKSIPELDQAAIDAIKLWFYDPIIIDGAPRGMIFQIKLTFSQNKKKCNKFCF
jgi:TonB family protein